MRCVANRELTQQRRQRLQKRHLKSELALLQTSSHLFLLRRFEECWRIFLEFHFKGLIEVQEKQKENRCLVFASSTKREIRQFHVV